MTLVVGDEDLLVDRAIQRAVGRGMTDPADLPTAIEASQRTDLAAVELTVDTLAELTSPSLFAEQRTLVVRSVQDADKAVADALLRLVEEPVDELTLVLVHAGGTKGKALLDRIRGAGVDVVTVGRIKSPRDREQFVLDEVRAAGASIDREAVGDLIAAVGPDLRELSTAVLQLVADVGRQVSGQAVATYHQGRAESTGFAVADRAVEGNTAAALETLRWAFATGLDPVLVSSSLAANLRLIAIVASAGRGSPDSLAGPLGLPAWKIRRAQSWARRWRPEQLAVAVTAVADADEDLKGAADDAAYAVERAVLAVAAAADA